MQTMCIFPPLWKKREIEKKKKERETTNTEIQKKYKKKGSSPVYLVGLSSPPQTHSESDLLGNALVSRILCLQMCAGYRRTFGLPRQMELLGLLDADPAAQHLPPIPP